MFLSGGSGSSNDCRFRPGVSATGSGNGPLTVESWDQLVLRKIMVVRPRYYSLGHKDTSAGPLPGGFTSVLAGGVRPD